MPTVNGISSISNPTVVNFATPPSYIATAIDQNAASVNMRVGGMAFCQVNSSGIFRYRSEALYGTGDLFFPPPPPGTNTWRMYVFWRYNNIPFSIISD